MTSMPASRSARAMIFAPRSWPSSPGFAITTLIFLATIVEYMNVKLIVVGCSPAWPNPGGAQSGYLVQAGGRRLLMDCGPGVLARLRNMNGSWPTVDAIVISHWHLDHWGDLVPWVWGRMFGLGRDMPPPELWAPPNGAAKLREFSDLFRRTDMFDKTCDVREYAVGEQFETSAGLAITAAPVPHYTIPTYAFRITDG